MPNVVWTKDTGCSPTPQESTMIEADESVISLSSEEEDSCSSDFLPSTESNDSDFEVGDPDAEKLAMRNCMIKAIKRELMLCLGIPQNMVFLIGFLAQKANCCELNVIITLHKIRLDLSYSYLGLIFGKSTSQIARDFKKTLPPLGAVLQNFIIWPTNEQIENSLPIAFRQNYRVHALIDCFEVSVEQPQNSVNQSLTWSDYKKCNTLKYLIAATPDGTVSFVSRGLGGRTTDVQIVEDSGFLDCLSPGMLVMADRGFKNISQLLEAKQCSLVRPPSVSKSCPMSKQECKDAKQIAALRTHIERVIGRIREFHSLTPHACLDHNLNRFRDLMVVVACGLINLHSRIIRF